MNKKTSIEDIANALGVSKSTVSRAISGKGRIGMETKKKILTYIDEHNYQVNVVARGLAQSKTYNICVVMPGEYHVTDLTFFQECLMGINQVSVLKKYDILLCICPESDILPLKRIIENGKVDGVLLLRTYVNDSRINYLKSKSIPFVSIGSADDGKIIQVDHDHTAACTELTSIILGKGIRNIALIGENDGLMVTRNRYQGFKDAHYRLGAEMNASLIYIYNENDYQISTDVEELVNNGTECIICMDDAVCGVVLRKLREMKCRIPQDIRVASFYNSKVLENHTPAITSLSFDAGALGQAACKELFDLLEGKNVHGRKLLSYEIVLKESTK